MRYVGRVVDINWFEVSRIRYYRRRSETERTQDVAELLTMMSVVSTAHDVTNVDEVVNGATKVYGVAQTHGEGWI